jgi:hypothetical protein
MFYSGVPDCGTATFLSNASKLFPHTYWNYVFEEWFKENYWCKNTYVSVDIHILCILPNHILPAV